MVRYILIFLLPLVGYGSDTPDYPYAVGDKRRVIATWTNSGVTSQIGEILSVAVIQSTGGTKLNRADGSVIWASSTQVNNSTEPIQDTPYTFQDSDLGLSVYIINNIPNQNLVTGNIGVIIYIGSAKTGAQLDSGAWIGSNGKDNNWRFLNDEDSVFKFNNSMVGGLININSTNSLHTIANVVTESMAETHDGIVIYSNGFPANWRVVSFFNPQSLPQQIYLEPNDRADSASLNYPEVWVQVESDGFKLPVYRPAGGQFHSAFALLYKEMDDLTPTSQLGNVVITNHTWYLMVPSNSATNPASPLYGVDLLYQKVIPNGIAGNGYPTGLYLLYKMKSPDPQYGIGWVDSIGDDYGFIESFEISTQSQDLPSINPEVQDYENDQFVGYLETRNYLASSPWIYQYNEETDGSLEYAKSFWGQSQYGGQDVNTWLQIDNFYDQMRIYWRAFNDDWHILNLEILYNIKSANDPAQKNTDSVRDYYWISPAKFRISGGLFNQGVLEDGVYVYEIDGFTIYPVSNVSSREMSPNISRYSTNVTYSNSNFDVSKSQFQRGGKLLTAQNNTILAPNIGTNNEGKKVYAAEHAQWYLVKTNYRVHSKVTGSQSNTDIYSVYQYAFINDTFNILN